MEQNKELRCLIQMLMGVYNNKRKEAIEELDKNNQINGCLTEDYHAFGLLMRFYRYGVNYDQPLWNTFGFNEKYGCDYFELHKLCYDKYNEFDGDMEKWEQCFYLVIFKEFLDFFSDEDLKWLGQFLGQNLSRIRESVLEHLKEDSAYTEDKLELETI